MIRKADVGSRHLTLRLHLPALPAVVFDHFTKPELLTKWWPQEAQLEPKGGTMSQMLMTPETLLNHWQGHRRLTRRVVEVFPEKSLFDYRVSEMRSFAELMTEVLNVETSVFEGLLSGKWVWQPGYENIATKDALVSAFAEVDGQREQRFLKLTSEKLQAIETDAWGTTSSNLERLLYVIDNEIHHRAQGYVYLRSLGIEPPAFYER